MKRTVMMLMALVFVSVTAFAEAADPGRNLTVRTFQFKHKQADKAAAMIKSLMSASGTFTVQPAANALVVTDDASNLKRIAEALAEFDSSPQPFRLNVRLISAGRGGEGTHVPEELADVESKLALLRYNSIDPIGSAQFDGQEGQPGVVTLASYQADFKFGEYDPSSDSIQIADFKLSRLDGDQLAQLMKTTLNLKLGQTVILAVTRDAKSQRALMMVLSARR